jgi:hypothetical protein
LIRTCRGRWHSACKLEGKPATAEPADAAERGLQCSQTIPITKFLLEFGEVINAMFASSLIYYNLAYVTVTITINDGNQRTS